MYDLVNSKIGNLEIIGYSNKDVCICKCDCKKIILILETRLKDGSVISCGHIDRNKKRLKKIYNSMKQRCYNPKSINYKYYGAIGIRVCEQWLHSYSNFYNWAMNNGYSEDLTLDRINNKKNYSPENCRWVNIFIQNNNRNGCKYINYNGKNATIAEWARSLGISRYKLIKKIKERGEEKAIEVFLKNNE